jgi:hypothetical protein
MLPIKQFLEVAYKVIHALKFMVSLAMMIPIWLMSLSMFHFTVVLNRFHYAFDSITPSVVQSFVEFTLVNDTITIRMDPTTMSLGLADYLATQFNNEFHPYHLHFNFYQEDQITLCLVSCFGVKTELTFQLYGQNFQFNRHYQLVQT